jgi:hypothetical protein
MAERDFSNRYSIRDNTSHDIDDLQLGCTLNKTIVQLTNYFILHPVGQSQCLSSFKIFLSVDLFLPNY